MLIWRLVLSILGVLVLLYGLVNLGLHIPGSALIWVAAWLVAAVIIHHGVVSPVVIGVSVLLRRLVPDRGRRYLQAALIAAVPILVIGIPMIYRQGSQPPSKALLLQNFTANLGLLLGLIAAVSLVGYAIRVAQGRSPGRRDTPST
jgi:uncharacterized membrane protein YhaH (DUF805 family)